MAHTLWNPSPVYALPLRGKVAHFPVGMGDIHLTLGAEE
jgi:hypothetical protein